MNIKSLIQCNTTAFQSIVMPFCAAAILLPASLHAKVLSLTVTDEGDSLSRAEVLLVDTTNNEIVDNNFTNEQGLYEIRKEGLFKVVISKSDYADLVLNNIDLRDHDVKKTVQMELSALSDAGGLAQDDDCD